jgi:hypothetical protein
VLQALKKQALLEYEKTPSKIDVMCDIMHTSLPSKAHVMHDAKGWSYLYSTCIWADVCVWFSHICFTVIFGWGFVFLFGLSHLGSVWGHIQGGHHGYGEGFIVPHVFLQDS